MNLFLLSTGADAPVAPGLRLDGVSRRYGGALALAPLSLHLEPGAMAVVAGPNGSGKTTLLRVAAGIVAPTTGRRSAPGPALYLRSGDGGRSVQTVRQAVDTAARLARAGVTAEVDDALAAMDLGPLAGARLRILSAGQRARVTLAVALVCRPALLCLDEPTVHLDEAGRNTATGAIRRLALSGTAVLVATHDGDFLAGVADARLWLHRGRLERAA